MIVGFDSAFYPLFSDISDNDGRLFTSIHSIFSACRSFGTMSVGPLGTLMFRFSPKTDLDQFAVARYKVWPLL